MSLKRIGILAGAAFATLFVIIVALHFGQISHDKLPFVVDSVFPPDKPFIPGEVYATTMAEIVDHELNSGFGWRPNDLFIWGPTVMADNNASRQIGIIMAIRETSRVFKDDLTKISSNEYDPNLVIADTDFRNDAARWMLPSAESKYRDGVDHLRLYVAGLHANPQSSANSTSATSSWSLCSRRGAISWAMRTQCSSPRPTLTAPPSTPGRTTTTSTTRRATRTSCTT